MSLGLLGLAPPSRMLIIRKQERKCIDLICGKSYSWQKATGRVLCLGEDGGMRALLMYPAIGHKFWGLSRYLDTALSVSRSRQCCANSATCFQVEFGLHQAGQSFGLVDLCLFMQACPQSLGRR